MERVFKQYKINIEEPFQSHRFRRGTASCLEKLGLQAYRINLHMGWTVHSKSMHTYRRQVTIGEVDKQFFKEITD
jgi:hypothetical protein